MGYGNEYPEDSWQAQRIGCFTASEIFRLLGNPKSKVKRAAGMLSEEAGKYVMEKVTEILTCTYRSVSNYATEWGHQYEPEAVAELEKQWPNIVHYGNHNKRFFPFSKSAGGSPDAIYGGTMVFEIKCPENPFNHVEALRIKTATDLRKKRENHYYQLQFNMLCVSKDVGVMFDEMRGKYVSYCPLFGEGQRLHIIDVMPEPGFRELVEEKIRLATEARNEIILSIEPKS